MSGALRRASVAGIRNALLRTHAAACMWELDPDPILKMPEYELAASVLGVLASTIP